MSRPETFPFVYIPSEEEWFYLVGAPKEGRILLLVCLCLTALIEESLGLGQKGFYSCHKLARSNAVIEKDHRRL